MSEAASHHATVMDDEARHVSRVYAEALYKAAQDKGQLDEALADLEGLALGVFKEDPGLELFFSSASIAKERKAEVIARAFEGRASSSFASFLGVLNGHDRLDMVRPIAAAFRALFDKRHRRMAVQAVSAVPLTDSERERLKAELHAAGGMEPLLQETVDPAILGGLIVRVDDWVYDASVRTRLESIKDQLIERSSHGIV